MEELSKGNQQKIQFIAAILHDPDVLIMDEPFSGLDPVNVQLLKEAFLEMRDRGKTLIFSTHQMETVEELCESICIIDRGRVVVHGSVRDVKRAMGRRVVRLATDGDGNGAAWLPKLAGVRLIAQREDFAELAVPDGTDPELILRTALERGEQVTRFEIADPSLEEVFIEHVGRPAAAEEERHLAEAGAGGTGGMSNLFPNAWHIARREYLQRVRSRSFFIVTLVLALVGIGLAMLPLGIRMLEGENQRHLAVYLPTRRSRRPPPRPWKRCSTAGPAPMGPTTWSPPSTIRKRRAQGPRRPAGRAADHRARRGRRPVLRASPMRA